ncbi:MAG: hypothetical protein K1X79_08205 [Oligoflexia bacterium]|nr:hypothetical protein [Oligoflexia bacterium]
MRGLPRFVNAPPQLLASCILHRRLVLAILLALALSLIISPDLSIAQTRRPPDGKSLKGALGGEDVGLYQFSFASTFDKIFTTSASTDLYDPITIQTLKTLRDEAIPRYNPEDVDAGLVRRVAEKALAIQSGRGFSRLVAGSELRGPYLGLMDELRAIQDIFRYSIQSTGEQVVLTRERKGKRLVELSLEFNLKQGVDPQIRFGDSVRFRYDYISKTPLLEYGFTF